MKRIGYRIYDPEAKKFHYSGSTPSMLAGYFKQTARLVTVHKMEHQSLVGLTDKNGVEVYEGDVVEHGINSSSARGVVIWDEICAGYRIERLDSDRGLSWAAYREQLWFRVIGNRYEHKGLLNG